MRDPLPTSPSPALARPAAALAALLALALPAVTPSLVRAGEPAPAAPAAPAAQPAPRAAAVESEIRLLERHLQTLRKCRHELNAGRAEPVPADDDARRAREADVRALREVSRYESARAKALAAATQAEAAKDEARAAQARTALESADRQFLEAMERLAAARDDGKADPAKSPATKPADGRRRGKAAAGSEDAADGEGEEG